MLKFAEHFVFIAAAMDRIGDNQDELWDEEDGFFYDVLRLPDGQRPAAQGALDGRAAAAVRDARSCRSAATRSATTCWPGCGAASRRCPSCWRRSTTPACRGVNGRRMLAVLDETKLRRVLARMLDEDEFLSPHGLRAAVALPRRPPVPLRRPRPDATRSHYLPAESDTGMFGGNSNWRGPVWFPVNYLILRGLLHLYAYYGDDVQGRVPDRLGPAVHAVRGGHGARPPAGVDLPPRRATAAARSTAAPSGSRPTRTGRTCVLFYEYFHGDNGAGLGASHQTGWTGLVARIIQVLGYLRPEDLLSDRASQRQPRATRGATHADEPAGGGRPRRSTSSTRRPGSTTSARAAGRPATLADVPAAEWDRVTPPGVDAVWLMGVWERSPAGRATRPRLARRTWPSFRAALADLADADVIGSAYCIRRYEVDARFGGRAGLAAARAALADRGRAAARRLRAQPRRARPPVARRPSRVLRPGRRRRPRREPGELPRRRRRRHRPRPRPVLPAVARRRPAQRVRARAARRPPPTRSSTSATRPTACAATWRCCCSTTCSRAPGASGPAPRPTREYWTDVIAAVRAVPPGLPVRRPRPTGTSSGSCSSSASTTATTSGSTTACSTRAPASVRGHLGADLDYQRRLVRFLENHDEPRAAAELAAGRGAGRGGRRSPRCPGPTLWHEGQFEGWRVARSRCSSAAARRSRSTTSCRAFHLTLVAVGHGRSAAATGRCARRAAGPTTDSCEQLLAWCWTDGEHRDARRRQRRRRRRRRPWSHLPWADLAGRTWRLDDLLGGASYERAGDDVMASGLYVGLDARAFHVLRWTPRED